MREPLLRNLSSIPSKPSFEILVSAYAEDITVSITEMQLRRNVGEDFKKYKILRGENIDCEKMSRLAVQHREGQVDVL